MNIGLIGAGTMGRPMARHLLVASHHLRLYSRRSAAFDEELAPLLAAGASPAPRLEALADCGVCLLNVTGNEDVRQLSQALSGVLAPGTLVIDHSTVAPEVERCAAALLAQGGVDYVDVPVSGGAVAAQAGSLIGMAGGTAQAVARAAEVFSAYIRSYEHLGPVGAGQVAKLCNQIAQVVTIQGIAEAMHFADLQAVPRAAVLKAIAGGLAGSRMLEMMGPKMVEHDYNAGIQNRLHEKDLRIALQAMGDHPSPALEVTHGQLSKLQAAGRGHEDTSALVTLLTPGESIS